jgi:hypothetical protein
LCSEFEKAFLLLPQSAGAREAPLTVLRNIAHGARSREKPIASSAKQTREADSDPDGHLMGQFPVWIEPSVLHQDVKKSTPCKSREGYRQLFGKQSINIGNYLA